MAWGVAFGLNDEIEAVLNRTVSASDAPGRQMGWYPDVVRQLGALLRRHGAFVGGAARAGAGMFSASAIPDIGSMMSSLGSIGSSSSGGRWRWRLRRWWRRWRWRRRRRLLAPDGSTNAGDGGSK